MQRSPAFFGVLVLGISWCWGSDVVAQTSKPSPGPPQILISSVLPPARRPGRYGITRADFQRIQATVPGIQRLVPVRQVKLRARYAESVADVTVVGTTSPFFSNGLVRINGGRALSEKDIRQRANVAVIDSLVAEKLFGPEDPIGRNLRIQENYFTIVGLAAGTASQGRRSSPPLVFVPLTTMRTRFGDMQVVRRRGTFEAAHYELSHIQVFVPRIRARQTAAVIEAVLKQYHKARDYSVKVFN